MDDPAGHPPLLHSGRWTPCWSCLRSWAVGRPRRPRDHPQGTGERAPLGPREGGRTRTDAGPGARRPSSPSRAAGLATRLDGGGSPAFRGGRRDAARERGRRGAPRGPAGLRRRTAPAGAPTPDGAGRRRAQAVLAVEVEIGAPTRTLRGFAAPAKDGSVVLVIRDITETRRSDQVRRDFVANASHELKTPAASIQAAAETIRTAAVEDPSVIPRFASQLEREAARLSQDRLGPARPLPARIRERDGRDGRARRDRPRRGRAVRGAGGRGGRRALDRGLVGVPRVPRLGAGPRVAGAEPRGQRDPVHGAGRQGATSSSRADDGEVVLAIVDTGLGIPSRDLPRIFERFYRVDRARSRETGGTGLGLSIVKHVAENHGGRVVVTSELGQGTRFEVRLPASA